MDDDLPEEIVKNQDKYKEFITITSEIYYGSGIGNQISVLHRHQIDCQEEWIFLWNHGKGQMERSNIC